MLEENHYYAFGLSMAGISSKALKTNYAENKLRYNEGTELQNKEFSDGSGLEMYETYFRQLDPQIGRFNQIDPLGEKYFSISSYAYANNNPANFNDPLGLLSEGVVDALSDLLRSPNGGSWSRGDEEVSFYSSQDEAFGAGATQMSDNGWWGGGGGGGGGGWARSFDAALANFNGGLITPGMVQGYFEQTWTGTGRYNISAVYSGGVHMGMGFNVSWNFDSNSTSVQTGDIARSDGNMLPNVGLGSRFISTDDIRALLSGQNPSNIKNDGTALGAIFDFNDRVLDRAFTATETMNRITNQLYPSVKQTLPGLIEDGSTIVTYVGVAGKGYETYEDVRAHNWANAGADFIEGAGTVFLAVTCPEALLLWGIACYINDHYIRNK
jgi:RHS repeat-associated protein